MDIGKTISEINASYEAAVLKHVEGTDAKRTCEILLTEPFFGTEWGVTEWNVLRQKWRWLGPRGQSHLYLKLAADTDYLVRIYVQTAVSEEVLKALTVSVNGTRCAHQGLDWQPEAAVFSIWAVVDRQSLMENNGLARITWSLAARAPHPGAVSPPAGNLLGREPQQAKPQPESVGVEKRIAFSKVTCQPYPAVEQ